VGYVGLSGPNNLDYLSQVDAATGTVFGRTPMGGIPIIPVVSNGTVYVGSDAGLYAFAPSPATREREEARTSREPTLD
jgi:outer membrane protein assembly factor BamB